MNARTDRQLTLLHDRVWEPAPRDTPFPQVIDPTIVRDFRNCHLRAYLSHWRGIVPGEASSPDLICGAAFARGLEIARRAIWGPEKADLRSALAQGLRALWLEYGTYEPPPNHVKSPLNAAIALVDYFRQYPPTSDPISPVSRSDGTPAVEFTGVAPLPGTRHPETGDPFLASARYDLVGEYQKGHWGVDEKTAKQLGPTWARQWTLRSQFTQYAWVSRENGTPLQGFIVRGIGFYAVGAPAYREAIIYHPEWILDRWLFSVQRIIDRMIECWETGYWDPALDDACSSYGGCPYRPLCESKDPRPWLADYVVRVWDPLAKNPAIPVQEDEPILGPHETPTLEAKTDATPRGELK